MRATCIKITKLLARNDSETITDTLPRKSPGEKIAKFHHVQNEIVGTNKMVVENAIKRAESLGYCTICVTTHFDGIAKERGKDLANLALYACSLMKRHGITDANKTLVKLELDLIKQGFSKDFINNLSHVAASAENSGRGLCLILAGETIVQLKSNYKGVGGRNQELALAAGLSLHHLKYCNSIINNYDVLITSIGTDGQDGPTDAAGAFADLNLISQCGFSEVQANEFLANNDTYNFYTNADSGSYHIKTGLTGTNVMDLQLVMIKEKCSH